MQTINLTIRCCLTVFKTVKSVFQSQVAQPLTARLDFKKSGVLNRCYYLAVVCTVLLLSSCQKESLSDDTMLNSTTASAASASAKVSASIVDVGAPNKNLNYGAYICPPTYGQGWLGFQQTVANQLGISCLRGGTLVPGNGNEPTLLASGYDVLFNFNSNDDEEDNNGNTPTPFVSDFQQYKTDLSNILALCPTKPVVAVIENEESNRFYYSGYAWDYIRQLYAAINVMHDNNIKVANGGLTSGGLSYLVYYDFLNQGKADSAEMFRKLTHVTPNSPITEDRGIFVDSLIHAYNQMDVDYVNFHWKCASPDEVEAFKEVVTYLQRRCTKPVISNEIGQYDNDPNTLLLMMQVCTEKKLPYIVWYSPDQKHNKLATPLQYDDATLTNTGDAYQSYLAQ